MAINEFPIPTRIVNLNALDQSVADAATSAAASEAARDAAAASAAAADDDATATAANRVQTGLDRVATAADRVATGEDRTAADVSAEAAAASAGFRDFADVATLLANTSLAYGADASQVAAGDVIRTRAEGFSYKVAPADTTDQHVATAGGVKLFPLRLSDGSLNAAQWGAVGDGVADDTAAIQAAIDYSMYGPAVDTRSTVRLNPGFFRTTDTLHLGYGTSFKAVILEGAGYRYRGSESQSGTAIVPDEADRPAINIQGARGSAVRGLSVMGLLGDYIEANEMGLSPVALIDDTLPANWNDPALPATQDSRYAPYAAITIDAYSGVRPATSYPDVSYPSFLGVVPQYGKNFSSDVLLEDVFISGFTVAVANQPSDADGNADFTTLRRVFFDKCKWGVSVGNSQSRNVQIDGMKASRLYSVLTNNQHGRQIGKFGGTISDLSIFGAINIFQFGTFYAGPIVFSNLYAESLWRLGDQAATSLNEVPFNFIGCEFSLGSQIDARGIPANVLGGAAQKGAFIFDGCVFSDYKSVVSIYYSGVEFRGGTFFRTADADRPKAYDKFAENATGGGLITFQLKEPEYCDIRVRPFNLDTGVREAASYRTPNYRAGSRKNCIPFWAMNIGAELEVYDSFKSKTQFFGTAIGKGAFSSLTLTGRTLEGTFASRGEPLYMRLGPLPGDVLWDDAAGMVFFVRSRTGTTFIAEAQNNYKSDGVGGFTTVTPFSTTTGSLYVRNARIYTPPYYLRGDTTAGSTTIANVARDDGFATWFDAQIAANDAFAILATQDNWLSEAVPFIAARSQAVPSITLVSAAGLRTQVRRRLDLFIRPGPANEASR